METTRRSFFTSVASVAALACVAPKLLAERTYSFADVKGLLPETPKRLLIEVFDYDVYRGPEYPHTSMWARIPSLEAAKNGQMFRLCSPQAGDGVEIGQHIPAREFDGSFGEKWYGIAVGDGGLILNDRKDSANRGHMEGFVMADFHSTFDSALAAYLERQPGNWVATPTQPIHHATLPGALDFNHGESLA